MKPAEYLVAVAVSPGAEVPEPGALPPPARWMAPRAGQPAAVLTAFLVWLVVVALFAQGGLLFWLAAVLPTVSAPGAGGVLGRPALLLIGGGLLLAAAGVLVCALALRRGRPWARVTLSLLAVLLAVGGLLRVVLRDPAGLVLVATLLAVVLTYLPSANPHFTRRGR